MEEYREEMGEKAEECVRKRDEMKNYQRQRKEGEKELKFNGLKEEEKRKLNERKKQLMIKIINDRMMVGRKEKRKEG